MTDMVGDWVVDWIYLLGYCIEMAYRKTARKNGGKKKAGLRRSKRAGLRRNRRATRKGGLKRGGLSRRVKRGGQACDLECQTDGRDQL